MGRRGRSAFGGGGHTFFVTTTVMNFDCVLDVAGCYEILRDSLSFVVKEHKAFLLAFVFMPSRIHLIITMPEGEHISDLMRDFKKYTSTRIRQHLAAKHDERWLQRLRSNARGVKRQVFKLWMDRFDDFVIESERSLLTKVEYVHENPVGAGLVHQPEEWPYSSARNYVLNDHSFLKVETEW